jgi:hypothetical protein
MMIHHLRRRSCFRFCKWRSNSRRWETQCRNAPHCPHSVDECHESSLLCALSKACRHTRDRTDRDVFIWDTKLGIMCFRSRSMFADNRRHCRPLSCSLWNYVDIVDVVAGHAESSVLFLGDGHRQSLWGCRTESLIMNMITGGE